LDPADYESMDPSVTVVETGDANAATVNVNDKFLAQSTDGTAIPIKVLFKSNNYIGICKYNSGTLLPTEIVPISIKPRSKENRYLSDREATMKILKNVKLFSIETLFDLHSSNPEKRNQSLFRMVAKKWGQKISPLLQQGQSWWKQLEPVRYSRLASEHYTEGNSNSMLLNDRVFLCSSENGDSTTSKVMICVVTVTHTGGGRTYAENEIQVHWYSIENTDPLSFSYTDGVFVRTGINVRGSGDDQKFEGAYGTYNESSFEDLRKLNNLKFYKLPDLSKSSGGKKRSIKNVKKRKSARKGNNNNKRKSNRRVKRSRSRSGSRSRRQKQKQN
jgi:hypothetical protein